MEGSVFDRLKYWVAAFVDQGHIRKEPVTIDKKINRMSNEKKAFLRELVEFILTSEFFNSDSKLYIMDIDITTKGVRRKLAERGINKAQSSVNNNIQNGRRKLESQFGKKFIVNMDEYDVDVEEYEKILTELQNEYSNRKMMQGKIALELPKARLRKNRPDDFDDLIQCIKPYIKAHMKAVSENLSKEALGYSYWILSNSQLNEQQQADKDYLVNLIKYDEME